MRRKTRHGPLIKVLQLIQYLMKHRFGGTIEELMEELGSGRRNVWRYLQLLEAVGIRVQRSAHGGYRRGPGVVRLVDRVDVAARFGIWNYAPRPVVAGRI